MTVPSQSGLFGFAPQAEKFGGDASGFAVGSHTWRRMLVAGIDLSTQELNEQFPPEIGGIITPTGYYKRGVFFGGNVDLIPRMTDIQGWLFYALMGNVSTVPDVDFDGVTATGVNTHIFRFDPTNQYEQPWLAVRKLTPGSETWGEVGIDCKIASARFNIPASGLLSMRMGVIGRVPNFDQDPSWTWDNSLEDFSSAAQGCEGFVSLGADAPAVLAASIDVINGTTGPREEMILGSRYMDDIMALRRASMIRITTKWNSPDLLQKALTGSASGETWSPENYRTQTVGQDWAFEVELRSPSQIASTGKYRAMRIRATDVVWIPDGSPNMRPGGFVTQDFIGAPINPASGDYLQILLQNSVSGYTWPT